MLKFFDTKGLGFIDTINANSLNESKLLVRDNINSLIKMLNEKKQNEENTLFERISLAKLHLQYAKIQASEIQAGTLVGAALEDKKKGKKGTLIFALNCLPSENDIAEWQSVNGSPELLVANMKRLEKEIFDELEISLAARSTMANALYQDTVSAIVQQMTFDFANTSIASGTDSEGSFLDSNFSEISVNQTKTIVCDELNWLTSLRDRLLENLKDPCLYRDARKMLLEINIYWTYAKLEKSYMNDSRISNAVTFYSVETKDEKEQWLKYMTVLDELCCKLAGEALSLAQRLRKEITKTYLTADDVYLRAMASSGADRYRLIRDFVCNYEK